MVKVVSDSYGTKPSKFSEFLLNNTFLFRAEVVT